MRSESVRTEVIVSVFTTSIRYPYYMEVVDKYRERDNAGKIDHFPEEIRFPWCPAEGDTVEIDAYVFVVDHKRWKIEVNSGLNCEDETYTEPENRPLTASTWLFLEIKDDDIRGRLKRRYDEEYGVA